MAAFILAGASGVRGGDERWSVMATVAMVLLLTGYFVVNVARRIRAAK